MKRWIIFFAVLLIGRTFADDVFESELAAAPPEEERVKPASYTIEPVSPQYNNRLGFSFDRLVFDHNEADNFYFGLDAWVPYFFSNNRNNHIGALYEGEVRMGYNLFLAGCDHFTPLIGAGYQFNNVGVLHDAKFAYATGGLRYYHEFNTVFGWGLFVKGLAGQQVGSKEEKKFAWGVDLSVPIVFRFSRGRHWDITLEPFYLYMETNHKHQSVFGGRGTFGYQF
jgi:hypothetical protein